MEGNTSRLVWIFGGAAALALAVGAFQLTQRPTRVKGTQGGAAAGTANAQPVAPVIVRQTSAPPPADAEAKGERTTQAVAAQHPENGDYVNRRYQNQVYPEVTILPNLQRDNPAEYERLVKLHNPEYAKVLDEQAAAEKAAAAEP